MNFDEALDEAKQVASRNGLPIVVVLLGIHRDDYDPEDAHGYCPVAAKKTLYPYGTVVATVDPSGQVAFPEVGDVVRDVVRPFCGNALRESDPAKWRLVDGIGDDASTKTPADLIGAITQAVSSAVGRSREALVDRLAERLAAAYWAGRIVEPGKFQTPTQRDQIEVAAKRDVDVWRPVAKSALGL